MADPTWRTDTQLHDMAHALGRKILQMYDEAGIAIDVPIWPGGTPSADTGDTIVQFVVKDAEDFMTLDPQRIMNPTSLSKAWPPRPPTRKAKHGATSR